MNKSETVDYGQIEEKPQKRLFRGKRKMPWWGWILVGILGMGVSMVPQHLMISTTASLDYHFMWEKKFSPDQAVTGAYLVFKHEPPPWVKEKDLPFLKRVGCVPGQSIRMTETLDFYCDDVFIGRALAETSKGEKLALTDFRGVLPEGKYFMVGDIRRSWDSRHFGPVDISDFIAVGIPLF